VVGIDFKKYLESNNIWHRFLEKPEGAHTKDSSEALGIDLKRLTKSLVLIDHEKNPVLAIIPGDKKLNYSKLRIAIKAKKIRWVPFDEAENYSGYPPGATPMIYHKMRMKVVIDKSLIKYDTIYGGGGVRTRAVELKTSDVINIGNAVTADITD